MKNECVFRDSMIASLQRPALLRENSSNERVGFTTKTDVLVRLVSSLEVPRTCRLVFWDLAVHLQSAL